MNTTTIPNVSTVDPKLSAVFPLVPGTKKPMVSAWQVVVPGQYQAAGNYGIALPPSILVLDADPRNYPPGRDVLTELLEKVPGIIPTRVVKTPSGGWHVYTEKPADVAVRKHQAGWPGIDFLSKGCYAVGPGTATTNGVYTVEQDRPIAKIPMEFFNSLERAAEPITEGAGVSLANLERFRTMCQTFDPPVKGSRGSWALKHAYVGRDLALPLEAVYAELRDWWNPRGLPPETDAVIYEQCEKAYRYPKNAFGCATPEARFTPDMAAPFVVMTPDDPTEQEQYIGKSDLPAALASRWKTFQVPLKFKMSAVGVEANVYRDGKTNGHTESICDHLAVIAKTRGVDGAAAHGLVLELVTLDKSIKEVVIPRRRLHMDGKLLAQELADMGFRIEPGKEQKLLSYLGDCTPLKEFVAVSRTGWAVAEENQEKLVFVFPSGATDPNYRYQPERLGASGGAKTAGTLTEWVTNVFGPVNSNLFALYEILKSLSAPLQMFAPVEGSEHLHGRTTTGKTTLIQIGASVWGSGADPSAASGTSYIHKWNMTANALEGLLSEHNDLPAYFDELGTYSGHDFDKLVYNATSGAGKDAMDNSRNLKKRRTWRTFITSTGELSLINRIEENSFGRKKTAKGGQLLRIVDRAMKENTFSSAAQVDAVKRACSTYYGTLGRAFVEKIIECFSHSSLKARVCEMFERAKERIKNNNPAFSAIQLRASGRFALAEVAGILLVEFGLIPGLTEAWARIAIDKVIREWEPSSRQMDDGERAIQALREFLLVHRDTRFKKYGFRDQMKSEGGEVVMTQVAFEKVYRDLAGFVDEKTKRYYIYPQALQEATGLEPKEAARELEKRGLLVRERHNKLTYRITVDGERPMVYAVNTSIISDENSSAEKSALDFSSLI